MPRNANSRTGAIDYSSPQGAAVRSAMRRNIKSRNAIDEWNACKETADALFGMPTKKSDRAAKVRDWEAARKATTAPAFQPDKKLNIKSSLAAKRLQALQDKWENQSAVDPDLPELQSPRSQNKGRRTAGRPKLGARPKTTASATRQHQPQANRRVPSAPSPVCCLLPRAL